MLDREHQVGSYFQRLGEIFQGGSASHVDDWLESVRISVVIFHRSILRGQLVSGACDSGECNDAAFYDTLWVFTSHHLTGWASNRSLG